MLNFKFLKIDANLAKRKLKLPHFFFIKSDHELIHFRLQSKKNYLQRNTSLSLIALQLKFSNAAFTLLIRNHVSSEPSHDSISAHIRLYF